MKLDTIPIFNDPEKMIFENIEFRHFDENNFPDYFVSKCGQVLSVKACRGTNARILTTSVNHNGYDVINIYLHKKKKTNTFLVHRLMAMAWIDEIPEKYAHIPRNELQVDHIDDVRSNNHVDNLQWISKEDHIKKTAKSEAAKAGHRSAAKNQGKKVCVLNLETQEEQMFDSVRSAERAYDRNKNAFQSKKLPREFVYEEQRYRAELVPQTEVLPGEIWKPIPKDIADALLNGADCSGVSVSNLGRKKNYCGKIQDFYTDQTRKYIQVKISGKMLLFHRVVAAAFVPEQARMMLNDDLLMALVNAGKETIEVNHINEDKTDCRPENLEWKTGNGNKLAYQKKKRKIV